MTSIDIYCEYEFPAIEANCSHNQCIKIVAIHSQFQSIAKPHLDRHEKGIY